MRNDNHFMVKPNGFLLEYTKNKYWRPTANRFLVQPSKPLNNAKFADFFFPNDVHLKIVHCLKINRFSGESYRIKT